MTRLRKIEFVHAELEVWLEISTGPLELELRRVVRVGDTGESSQ